MTGKNQIGPLENLMLYIQENFTETYVKSVGYGPHSLPYFTLSCNKHNEIFRCESKEAPGMFDSFRIIARHIESKHPELMAHMPVEEEVPSETDMPPKREFGTCAACGHTNVELTPKGRLKSHEIVEGKNCEGAGRKPQDA